MVRELIVAQYEMRQNQAFEYQKKRENIRIREKNDIYNAGFEFHSKTRQQ